VGTEKRQRQKQARQRRLEEARAAEVAAQRRSRLIRRTIAIVVIVIGAAIVLRIGTNNGDNKAVDATASQSPAPAGESPAPAGADPSSPRTLIAGTTPCPSADGTSPKTVTFGAPMMACIDTTKNYAATVSTSEGDFTVQLDAVTAPTTVNNFVALARYHFYDGVAFHRIVTGFMDQTGDPTGTPPGTGDPGYSFADELPLDGQYPDYSLAMANSGPNTNGGQWFVTVAGGGARLQSPAYSRFGVVTAGQDVVQKINGFGIADGSGTPTKPVTINTVTITET
jgi:peptidyl-prolyl cis-trans isomerase B (cyclophilin B)